MPRQCGIAVVAAEDKKAFQLAAIWAVDHAGTGNRRIALSSSQPRSWAMTPPPGEG